MAITSYFWDFGNGRYSYEKDPVHIYVMPGVYTVTLQISDTICGTLEFTFNVYVTDWDYVGGLNVSSTNKCLRYSMQPSRGFGWSEFGGDHWPFPEARVGTLKILDDLEQERLLVFDRLSGVIHELGVRDVFQDASDGDYGGYEIDSRLEFREEIGSARHYFLRSIEHHPEFVPYNEDNKNASGYTPAGFRQAMEVHFALRKDGDLTDTMKTRDIPLNGDITFKYDDEAHRWQPVVYTTASGWRLVGNRNYYERLDKAAEPNKRVMSEQDYQVQLANMAVHCGRQSLPYAKTQTSGVNQSISNLATGLAFTGSYDSYVSGPDGRAGSALKFLAGQGLTSQSTVSLSGNFAVAVWVRKPEGTVTLMDQAGGFSASLVPAADWALRFSDGAGNDESIDLEWDENEWVLFVVQRNDGLIQMYQNSSLIFSQDIGASVDYSGQVRVMNNCEAEVFEARLVNGALSAGTVRHHYEDVTRHQGKATCALF